jgi:hypothetical protein
MTDLTEAEADAVENDPMVAGSPAEHAYYWENGGEYPDGTHALDGVPDEEPEPLPPARWHDDEDPF